MTSETLVKLSRNYSPNKYRFIQAMRPFSLQVAFICVLVGITLAYKHTDINFFLCGWIFLATFLMQIGVNLINDFGDKNKIADRFATSSAKLRQEIRQSIYFNFYVGVSSILLSVLIGIYLASLSGAWLIWIGLIGVLSVFSYAQAPVSLKTRGLGLISVFIASGVLVVLGSFYVLTKQINLEVILLSLPISLLTSLILLSNEMRDYETDSMEQQKTLTVRIGYAKATMLYKVLALMPFAISIALYFLGIFSNWFFLLPALVFVPILFKNLFLPIENRAKLTKLTALYFSIFGLLQTLGIFFAT